jgi:hypothetical protein
LPVVGKGKRKRSPEEEAAARAQKQAEYQKWKESVLTAKDPPAPEAGSGEAGSPPAPPREKLQRSLLEHVRPEPPGVAGPADGAEGGREEEEGDGAGLDSGRALSAGEGGVPAAGISPGTAVAAGQGPSAAELRSRLAAAAEGRLASAAAAAAVP